MYLDMVHLRIFTPALKPEREAMVRVLHPYHIEEN